MTNKKIIPIDEGLLNSAGFFGTYPESPEQEKPRKLKNKKLMDTIQGLYQALQTAEIKFQRNPLELRLCPCCSKMLDVPASGKETDQKPAEDSSGQDELQ